jgi:hypothetical protein
MWRLGWSSICKIVTNCTPFWTFLGGLRPFSGPFLTVLDRNRPFRAGVIFRKSFESNGLRKWTGQHGVNWRSLQGIFVDRREDWVPGSGFEASGFGACGKKGPKGPKRRKGHRGIRVRGKFRRGWGEDSVKNARNVKRCCCMVWAPIDSARECAWIGPVLGQAGEGRAGRWLGKSFRHKGLRGRQNYF